MRYWERTYSLTLFEGLRVICKAHHIRVVDAYANEKGNGILIVSNGVHC